MFQERRAFDEARRAASEARGAGQVAAVAELVRLAVSGDWLRRDVPALLAAYSAAERLALEAGGPDALRPLLDAYAALSSRRAHEHDEPEVLSWLRACERLACALHERDARPDSAFFVARVKADLARAFERLRQDDELGLLDEPARELLRAAPPAGDFAAHSLSSARAAAASTDPAAPPADPAALFDLALGLHEFEAVRRDALTFAIALAEGRPGAEWARREAVARYHLAAPTGDREPLLRARTLLLGAAEAAPSPADAAWLAAVEARLGRAFAEAAMAGPGSGGASGELAAGGAGAGPLSAEGDLARAEAAVRAALRWSEAAGGAHELRYSLPGDVDSACRALGHAWTTGGDARRGDEFLRRGYGLDEAIRFYRKPRGGLADLVRGWHLLPPSKVFERSYGRVLEPPALDEGGAPVPAGPACQRIFGPTRDRCCACGRYGPAEEGVVCEQCGVEVVSSLHRCYRLGHLALAAPVLHPFYGASPSSPLGALLGLTREALRDVAQSRGASLVVDGGLGHAREGDLWRGEGPADDDPDAPKVAAGVEAIREVLRGLDLEAIVGESAGADASTPAGRRALVARALFERGWRPDETLVLRELPVLPPDFWAQEFGPGRGLVLRDGWFARLAEVVRASAALEALAGADPDDARARAAAEELDAAVSDLFRFCQKAFVPSPGPEGLASGDAAAPAPRASAPGERSTKAANPGQELDEGGEGVGVGQSARRPHRPAAEARGAGGPHHARARGRGCRRVVGLGPCTCTSSPPRTRTRHTSSRSGSRRWRRTRPTTSS